PRRKGAIRRRDARPAAIAPTLGRRDALLYLAAAAVASFGLGVAAFYLNFLYRALGFGELGIGILVGAQAVGVVAGAIPAATLARGHSRRTAILPGGTPPGLGPVAIAPPPLFPPPLVIAALSIVPTLLIREVPVTPATLDAPRRNALMRRFLVVETVFGFGAGSFLPFVNLFFADRFAVPFGALGLVLGVLVLAGSLGA